MLFRSKESLQVEKKEPQLNESWRKEFERGKKENDLQALDKLYRKVRIALNGIAQSKGEATVKAFEQLKADMEEHAKKINTKAKDSPINLVEVAKESVEKGKVDKAAKEVNTNPTEGQKEAGNYKKGHVRVAGFDITIENPKNTDRKGVDAQGNEWSTTMNNHYGYFKRTKGKDGDHIDVFVGDNLQSDKVFVVDQVDEDGAFDEHKVMLGFESAKEAKEAYLSNYEDGWNGLKDITETTIEDFKKWIDVDTKKSKAFADYKEKIGRAHV